MLILLHGDNIEASRAYLNKLRQEASQREIRELDEKQTDPTALTQALESSSLFGAECLVIIENLLSRLGKREKIIEEFATILKRGAENTDVVLYEEKEIRTGWITKLGKKIRVQLFKTPALIFNFLDGLAPGNTKSVLLLLRQVVTTEPVEVVFVMLVRRIRQLMMLADGVRPEGLQAWQVSRLTAQARLFTMKKLRAMHQRLLEIDVANKTSASPFTLSQQIEQFLIEL